MTLRIFQETRVTLPRLRKEHPEWHWRAERYGMGWRYHGIHRTARDSDGVARMAVIYAVAKLAPRFDGDDDNFATEWRVEDEGRARSTSYSFWAASFAESAP